MPASEHGWAWLDGATGTPADATAGAADLGLARAFARCFGSADGDRAIRHLRAVTTERVLGAGASDALLRHTEGQRQLVAYIAALVARGRSAE